MNPLPETRWDTELFVLQAADRAELQRVVLELGDALSRRTYDPADLAFTLNTSPFTQPARLALVAGTQDELRQRLARAAERLADAGRPQIRDVGGLYYFERPLAPEGKLAFLFPGEGAQYLGMLGDLLAIFPEARECIDFADARDGQSGGKSPLSRFLTMGKDAPQAERSQAERELRELTNAMSSVLLGDWILWRILARLELRPEAMAGHSIGELGALWSAGCIQAEQQWRHLVAAMRQSDESELPEAADEAVLLAVGTSRQVASDVLAQATQGNPDALAFLAMDNCPHQTVLVGRSEAMAAVEAELQQRSLVYERLTLQRPYHTPLFKPMVGPISRAFAGVEFFPPSCTIYSCTTAAPFPTDPDAIRQLAVSHWYSRVEFTRMIENMHADGVRLFVEVGPRGNLCSFVEDILRGKPFLAAAANVAHRSGLAQLHHLAGQLAAHHVPMNFAQLYRDRRCRFLTDLPHSVTSPPISSPAAAIESATAGRGGHARCETFGAPDRSAAESVPAGSAPAYDMAITRRTSAANGRPDPRRRAEVVQNYWEVMEDFLDTQQRVMQGYLARQRGARHRPSPATLAAERLLPSPAPPALPPEPPEDELFAAPASEFPFLGSVVNHVPGQELVIRRRLTLEQHPYAADHTVGGRQISRVDPHQHGLPIGPMTFTLEMMAELGARLCPGRVVIQVKNVRLMRWLAFDAEDPTTVEAIARLSTPPPPSTAEPLEVAVEIRDLGNSSHPAAGPSALAATGIVVLAAQYPEAPASSAVELQNPRPLRVSVEEMYEDLFHGPLFQGVTALERIGDNGIDASLVVLPREGLLAGTTDPRFLTDPVLLDVAMHPFGAWHLEQPNRAGRILLPFELPSMEFFGPRPAVGATYRTVGRIKDSSSRHFTHSVELVQPDGRVWSRSDCRCWRFYFPFGDVNFHGRKDEYFISEAWERALPECRRQLATCVYLKPPADLSQLPMQQVMARVMLSPREMPAFRSVQGSDGDRARWLFGRMAAKDAARLAWFARYGERLFPADMEVEGDDEVAVRLREPQVAAELPRLALAYGKGLTVALAAFAPAVGLDLQPLTEPAEDQLRERFDAEERRRLEAQPGPGLAAIRWWGAKSALARAFRMSAEEAARACQVTHDDPSTGAVSVACGGHQLTVHTLCERELVVATWVADASQETAVSNRLTGSHFHEQ